MPGASVWMNCRAREMMCWSLSLPLWWLCAKKRKAMKLWGALMLALGMILYGRHVMPLPQLPQVTGSGSVTG